MSSPDAIRGRNPRRRGPDCIRATFVATLAFACAAASASTLTIGLLVRADDERLTPIQAALERRSWTASDFGIDGFKGVRLSYRAWDRQLRQPLLLTDGQGVVATAPVEGVLHAREVLDTLGADAPERLCGAAP